MNITSKAKPYWVEITIGEVDGKIVTPVSSHTEAETMIAQFRDVMEDFYRVWPLLREDVE